MSTTLIYSKLVYKPVYVCGRLLSCMNHFGPQRVVTAVIVCSLDEKQENVKKKKLRGYGQNIKCREKMTNKCTQSYWLDRWLNSSSDRRLCDFQPTSAVFRQKSLL